MQLFLAVAFFATFLFLLPRLLRKLKSARRGDMGAFTLAIGLAFSSFLDPARKISAEQIEKQKDQGSHAQRGDTNPP